VVIEYQPPERLKPAQMGLLLDERADTKDVTATIVDLAVHGYLTITEIPKKGLFGSKNWTLTRKRTEDNDLERYERLIFNGLFEDGDEVKLSDLKNKYYKALQKAQKALYADAAARKWFVRGPESARSFWRGVAIGLIVLGAALAAALGFFFGMALLGVPVAVVGVILLLTAGAMPQRTARGSGCCGARSASVATSPRRRRTASASTSRRISSPVPPLRDRLVEGARLPRHEQPQTAAGTRARRPSTRAASPAT
jgi:uncharacterized membrane protein